MKLPNLIVTSIFCFLGILLSSYTLTSQTLTLDMFKSDISCAGMTDGNAGVSVSGGVEPYSYLWSTGANTSTIGNLDPGTYTVTVTDNAGTQMENGTFLEEIEPIQIRLEAIDGICGNLGKIKATVSGGIGPFQYNWSNGEFETEIRDLEEGEYTVTITDRGRCGVEESASVLVNGEGLELTTDFADPSCVGASDGRISVSQTGGQMPVEFTWNDGNEETTIENLNAGSYSISAVDAFGCTDGLVVILRDPDELIVEIINQNNSLFARVEGGNPPYNYEWSNGVTGSAVISNLPTGDYFITVTDDNDCVANAMGDVLGPLSAEDLNEVESFQMFPSIVHNDLAVRLQLVQSETISFEIYSASGQLIKTHIDRGQSIYLDLPNIFELQSGMFFLRVSSNTGWAFTEKFIKL